MSAAWHRPRSFLLLHCYYLSYRIKPGMGEWGQNYSLSPGPGALLKASGIYPADFSQTRSELSHAEADCHRRNKGILVFSWSAQGILLRSRANSKQFQNRQKPQDCYRIRGKAIYSNTRSSCCAPQAPFVDVAMYLLGLTTNLTAKCSNTSDRRKKQLPWTNKGLFCLKKNPQTILNTREYKWFRNSATFRNL